MNPRDQKKFWKVVQSLKKSTSSIPTLSHNANDNIMKANMLNLFFSTCFYSPLTEEDDLNMIAPFECPFELLCTIEEVEHLLTSLDTSKATGPDRVSATMLKHTATSIAPLVTNFLTYLLNLVKCQLNRKDQW